MTALSPEATLLWSVGGTLLISITAVAYLHKPLRGVIHRAAGGDADLGRFWTSLTHLVFICLPLVCTLSGFTMDRQAAGPPVLQIASQMQWAMLGLVLSLFSIGIVALVVTATAPNSTTHFSADQVEEIHRLLLKLEDFRAKEILKHPNAG